jgi:hypothetical protein
MSMNPPSVKRIRLALGVATLCAVQTAVAADKDGTEYLTLRTPQRAITLQVAGDNLTSPDIQLTRDHDNLRGRALGRVVFLQLKPAEVGGTVGNSLTRLLITEKGNVTTVRGNFAGGLSDFQLSPQSLEGKVGPCSYDLKATADGSYEGSRSCGGPPQLPVVLDIPPSLAQQGSAMTLATVTLVLGAY